MRTADIRRTLQREFVRTLRRPFVEAVREYDMVQAGDKIAVCISGGKDSMLLALLLQDLQHTVDFELVFLAMDPGYAPAGRAHLEENAARLGLPLEIFQTNVLRVAGNHASEHPCFLCAKMRRDHLYAAAQKRGCGEAEAVLDELAECVPAPGSVDENLDAQELAGAIDGFLRSQDARTRRVFVQRCFECAAVPDIARRNGMSEQAVRSLLHRTRRKLRAYLESEELI